MSDSIILIIKEINFYKKMRSLQIGMLSTTTSLHLL